MAIRKISCEYCPAADEYREEFVLDSATDVADLPECCPGSTAMVADKDGAMYMVNASGEWVEV